MILELKFAIVCNECLCLGVEVLGGVGGGGGGGGGRMSKDCYCFVGVDGCAHAGVLGYVRVFVVSFFSFCACAGKSAKP